MRQPRVSRTRTGIGTWAVRKLILTAGCQAADHIDESPTEFLHDEQGRTFKDIFQVFGRPIIGQTHKT